MNDKSVFCLEDMADKYDYEASIFKVYDKAHD